jgi:hypothetical protein
MDRENITQEKKHPSWLLTMNMKVILIIQQQRKRRKKLK